MRYPTCCGLIYPEFPVLSGRSDLLRLVPGLTASRLWHHGSQTVGKNWSPGLSLDKSKGTEQSRGLASCQSSLYLVESLFYPVEVQAA